MNMHMEKNETTVVMYNSGTLGIELYINVWIILLIHIAKPKNFFYNY